MKKRVRRGFTLPEILVTVTVVAVLAAVVVPAVTQYVNKGDTPATQQDLVQIRNAITAYVADTRQNPPSLYALTTAPVGVSNWHGPYLSVSVQGNTSVGSTGVNGTGYMTSSGLGIALGETTNGAIVSSNGYLTIDVALTGSNTCADLYNLDKYLDQGTSAGAATGAAASDATNGSLTWNNASCVSTTTTAPIATLKLVTIGS